MTTPEPTTPKTSLITKIWNNGRTKETTLTVEETIARKDKQAAIKQLAIRAGGLALGVGAVVLAVKLFLDKDEEPEATDELNLNEFDIETPTI